MSQTERAIRPPPGAIVLLGKGPGKHIALALDDVSKEKLINQFNMDNICIRKIYDRGGVKNCD